MLKTEELCKYVQENVHNEHDVDINMISIRRWTMGFIQSQKPIIILINQKLLFYFKRCWVTLQDILMRLEIATTEILAVRKYGEISQKPSHYGPHRMQRNFYHFVNLLCYTNKISKI